MVGHGRARVGSARGVLALRRAGGGAGRGDASTPSTCSGTTTRSSPGGRGPSAIGPATSRCRTADLLLVLGARLNIRQVWYNWQAFARAAYKIMVDVDAAELRKPTLSHRPARPRRPARLPRCRAGAALRGPDAGAEELALRGAWSGGEVPGGPAGVLDAHRLGEPLLLHGGALRAAAGTGPASSPATAPPAVTSFQAAALKRGTRLFHNSGSAPMGFDLPAAVARGRRDRQGRRLPRRRWQHPAEPSGAADHRHAPAAGEDLPAQQPRLPLDPADAAELLPRQRRRLRHRERARLPRDGEARARVRLSVRPASRITPTCARRSRRRSRSTGGRSAR